MHQDGARTMARYNAWMNRKLISKAQDMGLERIEQDQKAFFGSIAATFQHIMIGDLVWLRRYAEAPFFQRLTSVLLNFPEPKSLHERIFSSWHAYTEARTRLDDILINFADSLTAEELATELEFRTMKGDVYRTPLWQLLTHLFNHQTHHRGQITTLMMQQGFDPGVTDLVAMLREAPLPSRSEAL
jgi:uncharacterized damage-inducible protein DinB